MKQCDTLPVSHDTSSVLRAIQYGIVRYIFQGRAILYSIAQCCTNIALSNFKTLQELEQDQTRKKISTPGSTGSTFRGEITRTITESQKTEY